MRAVIRKWATRLFGVAMLMFLATAAVLVLGQLVSLVAVQGAWIVALSEALLQPAIVMAMVVGVLGFVAFSATQQRGDADG